MEIKIGPSVVKVVEMVPRATDKASRKVAGLHLEGATAGGVVVNVHIGVNQLYELLGEVRAAIELNRK